MLRVGGKKERHLLYTKTENQRQNVKRIQRGAMDKTQRSNPFTPNNYCTFIKAYVEKEKEKKKSDQ